MRTLSLVLGMTALVASTAGAEPIDITKKKAASATTTPDAVVAEESPRFLRVIDEPGESVALEIACAEFVPADADLPVVTLVGVVHIGDNGYYRQLQEYLRGFDVVLYESVKPPGTGGAGGETMTERRESTQAALDFVQSVIESHRRRTGAYPDDLADAARTATDVDPRLVDFLNAASTDAWSRDVVYLPRPDGDGYDLYSLGADGAPGGSGADADIMPSGLAGMAMPLTQADSDNLQSQLAGALALDFQLDAIDYGQSNFICSDMSMDQVQRAMAARGSDFTLVEGTLAGSSLPGQLVKLMLGVIRIADRFMGGALSDGMKVLLIEMLGDESTLEVGLTQFDPAFGEVIIGERNRVVVEDLRTVIVEQPKAESVAIFYGAGHMPDFARRLDALGYSYRGTRWLRAIEVDLESSVVTEADVRQLRFMTRRALQQMKRQAGQK